MIKRFGIRSKVYPLLSAVAWVCGFLGTAFGGLMKADLTKIPQNLSGATPLLTGIQACGWYLIPCLGMIVGLCVLARKMMGEPWVWDAIHHMMNSYRDFVFSAETQEAVHHHRVTLFRHYQWFQWPCFLKRPIAGKLIPVARSGHTTQRTDVAFLAPDDGDKAEGFAGKVWATFSTFIETDLPDLNNQPTDEMFAEYAKRTFSDESWIRERHACGRSAARCFCGIAVRVKGREWGVIVIDSRSPKSIKPKSEAIYDLMGRSLGKLLERV